MEQQEFCNVERNEWAATGSISLPKNRQPKFKLLTELLE